MTGLRTREVVSRMSVERDSFRRRLGERLAGEMEVRGVSARNLAEATNIEQSRIERIARGEVGVIDFELPLLAECLGVRAEDLVDGRDG